MLIEIDYRLFVFLNTAFSNSFFDLIIPQITNSTNLLLSYFFVSGLHIAMSKQKVQALKRVVIASILLGLMDWVGHNVIKEIFSRPRPNNIAYFIDGVHVLFPQCNFLGGATSTFLSFPSNHALTNAAVTMFWTLFYPKAGFFLLPFTFLIAFTRIYVGVHYPLDVLFGIILGFGFGYLTYRLTKKMEERKHSR